MTDPESIAGNLDAIRKPPEGFLGLPREVFEEPAPEHPAPLPEAGELPLKDATAADQRPSGFSSDQQLAPELETPPVDRIG